MMEQSTIKAEILSGISLELDVWLSEQEAIKDSYEYKAVILNLHKKINRTILLKSLGKQPGSRNKKTSYLFWEGSFEQRTSLVPAYATVWHQWKIAGDSMFVGSESCI